MLVVIITLVAVVPAAYSLTRLAGRWGEGLGIAIFLVYLVPPTLLFIPLSRVVADLGLTQLDLVDGARLPDLHHPLLHLAADGLLQVDPLGHRGAGDDRRLQPPRRDLAHRPARSRCRAC